MAILGKKGIITGKIVPKQKEPQLPKPVIQKKVIKEPEPVNIELTEVQLKETRGTWHPFRRVPTGLNDIQVAIVGCATGCGLMQLYNTTSYFNALYKITDPKEAQDKVNILLRFLKNEAGSSAFMFTLGDTYAVYIPLAEKYFKAKELKNYKNKQHGGEYRQTIHLLDLNDHEL